MRFLSRFWTQTVVFPPGGGRHRGAKPTHPPFPRLVLPPCYYSQTPPEGLLFVDHNRCVHHLPLSIALSLFSLSLSIAPSRYRSLCTRLSVAIPVSVAVPVSLSLYLSLCGCICLSLIVPVSLLQSLSLCHHISISAFLLF